MNKQTKLLTLLGILSIIMFPGMSNAQQYVKEGRAAVKALSKTPEITQAAYRAIDVRNIQRSIAGGARLITGAKAATPSIYSVSEKISPTSIGPIVLTIISPAKGGNEEPLLPQSISKKIASRKYPITRENAFAISAGAYPDGSATVDQAISQGGEPKFAFYGAVVQANLDLAGEIAQKYKVNVNAPIFGEKTIAELLPDLQKNDQRLVWLLDNGLDPNVILTKRLYEKAGKQILLQAIKTEGFKPDMVMKSKAYRSLDLFYFYTGDIFDALVENGLNPMAADNDGYTALHWYAHKFYNGRHLSLETRESTETQKLEAEGKFLTEWVAKFPETNINAQDLLHDTPAHYVRAKSSRELDPFGHIRGFDPTLLNDNGDTPEESIVSGRKFWRIRFSDLRRDIEDLILDYKYKGKPTATQKEAAEKEALDYLHNPQPEKLVDYFLSLGATPEIIEDRIHLYAWAEIQEEYWVRDEILEVLYKRYDIKRFKYASKSTYSRPDPYPPYVYEDDPETDAGGEGFDDD